MSTILASLTSRERVIRALTRKDQDRIPRHESFWGETLDRWMGEGLAATSREEAAAKVLDALDGDMRQICWFWPHPFPGRFRVLSEDAETRTTMNESGTIERYWKTKSGTPEHLGWDCDSREKWEKEYKPAFLNQPVQLNLEETRLRWEEARRRQKWTYLAGVEAFETLRKILGDEAGMIAVLDDPDWVADIAETQATVLLRNYQAVIDAGIQPDGLWLYGDMAFKNMTFCSPAAYRELVWPQHKRIADWVHANGMKIIFHSDGDLRKVVDLYIEAGFDCMQPMESKASMDIRELAPKYAGKISFFGNIDVMKLLTNDLDLIEEEIRTKFAAGMATKGYLYHSDHSVPPQVSWRTYQAVIRMVDRYGRY
jgi:uroporphyrinogen decarboxylase